MLDLPRTLRRWIPQVEPTRPDPIVVKDRFCTPGFWATFACFALARGVNCARISFADAQVAGYASAMGFRAVLGDADDYAHGRPGEGRNYSSLELLDSPESTDGATRRVNNCIRRIFSGSDAEQFVQDVCNIVAELHENVWAHGMATGISMAQRWQGRFEFALADSGCGLLPDVRRINQADTDQQAIDWCIRPGTTTKPDPDDWAQALPEDALQDPMGHAEQTHSRRVHHAGLGLYRFCELVQLFQGSAWIASGDACLEISRAGRRFATIPGWQGVAIACRFTDSGIHGAPARADSPRERAIADILRRAPG